MIDLSRTAELDRALELSYYGFRRLVEAPDRLLATRGLSRVHHRILYFVARRPGLSVGELLDFLAVTKQALHGPLRQLAARRLVGSSADPLDRRVRRLALTRAGAGLERRLTGMQHAHLTEVFGRVGPRMERGWREVMTSLGGR